MAMNPDIVASTKGHISIVWGRETQDELVERNQFESAPSGLSLKIDADLLAEQAPEVRAALIARELYGNQVGEFNTHAYKLAAGSARRIAAYYSHRVDEQLPGVPSIFAPRTNESPEDSTWVIDYFADAETATRDLQEVAWLRFAFQFGASAGDLLEWGVSDFAVQQLTWWQRREGETILQQHIRALRNGWATRFLSAAVRDSYANLTRTIKSMETIPEWFEDAYGADFREVLALEAFFSPEATRLNAEQRAAWAQAFAASGVSKIVPDAIGPASRFVQQAMKEGNLLFVPLEFVARYLEQIGVTPALWGKFNAAEFFGRAS